MSNILSKDYAGVQRVLVDEKTGEPIGKFAVVNNFRGDPLEVLGGRAPHKPGSTGFVSTDKGEYYAGVINAKRAVVPTEDDLEFESENAAYS